MAGSPIVIPRSAVSRMDTIEEGADSTPGCGKMVLPFSAKPIANGDTRRGGSFGDVCCHFLPLQVDP